MIRHHVTYHDLADGGCAAECACGWDDESTSKMGAFALADRHLIDWRSGRLEDQP